MGKAIAIALVRDNALTLSVKSIVNILKLIADFMYGTEERTKFTYAFVVGITLLAAALQISDAMASGTCTHDTLATVQ